jgi:hypothetical protein
VAIRRNSFILPISRSILLRSAYAFRFSHPRLRLLAPGDPPVRILTQKLTHSPDPINHRWWVVPLFNLVQVRQADADLLGELAQTKSLCKSHLSNCSTKAYKCAADFGILNATWASSSSSVL